MPLAALTSDDIQKFQRDVTDGKTAMEERTRKRGRAIVKDGRWTRVTQPLGF